MTITISTHDDAQPEASAVVDQGLGDANDAAAPLHEVRPLRCFARDAAGRVVGGAVGRTWGGCCELQQLWVDPARRRAGLGAALVRAFEAHAAARGCTDAYLETFNFQAPGLYAALGYTVAHTLGVFPHGIVRHLMVKRLPATPGARRTPA